MLTCLPQLGNLSSPIGPLEGMTTIASLDEGPSPAAAAVRSRCPTERRLALMIAMALVIDACLYLYWSTGATWPASNAFDLSVAVLGLGVPFRPGMLLLLAALLLVAAALVLGRGFVGRRARFGLLLQAGTAVVTAGLLLRGLFGVAMPLIDDYKAVLVDDTEGLWTAWPEQLGR